MKVTNNHMKLYNTIIDRGLSRGCHDISSGEWNILSKEEQKEVVQRYHEWNGDPESFDERHLGMPDFAYIRFINHCKANKMSNTITSPSRAENKPQLIEINEFTISQKDQRAQFAAMFMQALLVSHHESPEKMAQEAIENADALIKKLEER